MKLYLFKEITMPALKQCQVDLFVRIAKASPCFVVIVFMCLSIFL